MISVYHCAAAKGQLKCLKLLCKQDSNIWLRNRRGDYPVHEAYYNRQMECLYFLLDAIGEKRASKSSNMYDGRTILHLAAADNDLKLCKRLVADGVDVNCLMKTSPTTYMTPYDVAVIKNSAECARYLKSLGAVVGSEIVIKLQSLRNTKKLSKDYSTSFEKPKVQEKTKARTKDHHSSGEEAKMERRKEKLRSNEKTAFYDGANNLTDDSNQDEQQLKTDENIEFTESERSESDDDNDRSLPPQNIHRSLNKRPITQMRNANKSNITESAEKQKKRDEVLAAQMAQAEKERRRRQHEQAKREDKTSQKMNNIQSVYTQAKSKSTVSRKGVETKKEPNTTAKQTKVIKNSNFLPTLTNGREPTRSDENQQRKLHSKKFDEENEQQSDSRDKAECEDDPEGMVKSKYTTYDSDEDSNSDTVDHKKATDLKSNRLRSQSKNIGVNTLRETSKPNINKKKSVKSNTDKMRAAKKSGHKDYDDEYEDVDDENRQNDTSDNTSLSYEKTKKNVELGLKKDQRKRFLDIPTPSRSRQHTKSRLVTDENLNESDENLVRLVIKPDLVSSNPSWARKRYASLFDKQRLILKSLYEIRRSRINNRDIIVSADLNNMLIKSYDYDIRKNCRSLRDLEKVLEMIAVEISDEYKKTSKRSHTLLTFKPKNNINGGNSSWRSTENIKKFDDKKRDNQKSKSQVGTFSETVHGTETLRLKQEKQQMQDDHLKIAYRSLLPNDIYKQYFNTNARQNNNKENPNSIQKEKSILLPVISQKQSFTT